MGLLDFNDPNALANLGLITGLLNARKGDNWPMLLQQAAMRQEAIKRGQVEEDMRRQQMAHMQRQQAAEDQRRAVVNQLADQHPQLAPLFQLAPEEALKRAFPEPQKPKMAFAPSGEAVDMNALQLGKTYRAAPEGMQYDQQGQLVPIPGYVQMRTQIAAAGRQPAAAPEGPKPPPGYRYRPDSTLEPIPGGPADAKVGKEAEALQKRQAGALERADFVLGKVREAIKETGPTTAGPLGAISRNIPGTGGYNLNKTLDAIKANIGFAELQAMREASPTGGALGQVAVQELAMLQSVLGSLDSAQSPQQLERALYAIEKHYNTWKEAVKRAGREGGASSSAPNVVDFNSLPK